MDLTPLLLVAFTGLLWLDDGSVGPWASFRLGYAFGFGFFVSGLYWIAAALFVGFRCYPKSQPRRRQARLRSVRSLMFPG